MQFLAYLINANKAGEENKNKDTCAEHGRCLITRDVSLLGEIVRISCAPPAKARVPGGAEDELATCAAHVVAQLSRCRDSVLPLAMFEREILVGSMHSGTRRMLVAALTNLSKPRR